MKKSSPFVTSTDLLTTMFMLLSLMVSAQGQEKLDFKRLDSEIENLAKADRFSGIVLIAKGDKTLYTTHYGMADKALGIKIDANSIFNIASMGKMFTGVAISKLVYEGKLKYEDRLESILKYLPKETFSEITIEQLLTHTSGLGDIFTNPNFFSVKDHAKSIQEYVELCIEDKPISEPGTEVRYSNYGYILLGAVIEKIVGKSFYDYVQEEIFDKAGMEASGYFETDKDNPPLVVGYASPPGRVGTEGMNRQNNRSMIEVKGTSAGGAYSTGPDLLRFSLALQGSDLLPKEWFAKMSKGQVVLPRRPAPPGSKPRPEVKYGYGFGEFWVNGQRIVGHNGGAPGIDVQMDIYPELGYTVVILSNYNRTVRPIIGLIQNMITGKPKK